LTGAPTNSRWGYPCRSPLLEIIHIALTGAPTPMLLGGFHQGKAQRQCLRKGLELMDYRFC